MLQAQQLQAEADRQVADLTNSLKQAQSQAAALSSDKDRLHAQLNQHQAAAPVQTIPQVSLAKYHVNTESLAP